MTSLNTCEVEWLIKMSSGADDYGIQPLGSGHIAAEASNWGGKTNLHVFPSPNNNTDTGGGGINPYDDDDDDQITASELGDAVTDFGKGELTASELGEVVTAFGQS